MANPVLPTSKSLLTSSEAATKHLNKMEENPSTSKLEQFYQKHQANAAKTRETCEVLLNNKINNEAASHTSAATRIRLEILMIYACTLDLPEAMQSINDTWLQARALFHGKHDGSDRQVYRNAICLQRFILQKYEASLKSVEKDAPAEYVAAQRAVTYGAPASNAAAQRVPVSKTPSQRAPTSNAAASRIIAKARPASPIITPEMDISEGLQSLDLQKHKEKGEGKGKASVPFCAEDELLVEADSDFFMCGGEGVCLEAEDYTARDEDEWYMGAEL